MSKSYVKFQQELTELNSDGNDTRGRNGEDYESVSPWKDEDLPKNERLKKEQAMDRRNEQ